MVKQQLAMRQRHKLEMYYCLTHTNVVTNVTSMVKQQLAMCQRRKLAMNYCLTSTT